MIPGRYTLKGCSTQNKETSKKRRKIIRGHHKNKEDVDIEKEGTLYEAGGFLIKKFHLFYVLVI